MGVRARERAMGPETSIGPDPPVQRAYVQWRQLGNDVATYNVIIVRVAWLSATARGCPQRACLQDFAYLVIRLSLRLGRLRLLICWPLIWPRMPWDVDSHSKSDRQAATGQACARM